MGVDAEYCNIYDLENHYEEHLTALLGSLGQELVNLNLGADCGDLLRASLSSLSLPVDFLISGPPCPPWSAQGVKAGTKDPRARVFFRILKWVLFFILCGGLMGCIIENVLGMTFLRNGFEPAIEQFLRILRTAAPEFHWSHSVLEAVQYQLPQTRVRVFLCGIRKAIVDSIPPPLDGFGKRPLRLALGVFPPMVRENLTDAQQTNLMKAEETIGDMLAAGKLQEHDLIVFSVDRGAGDSFQQHLAINVAPTMTTHNQYLMVIEAGDVLHNVPDSQRRYFRLLKETERLTFQGFPADVVLHLKSGSLARKAAGNAYPPPLIAAVAWPMVKAISAWGVSVASWPPSDMIALDDEKVKRLQRLESMCKAPPRVAKEKAKRKAKAKAKKRKRASESD